MEAKKNWRVDLERKRLVLFNVGLLVAGAFTLAAFTYTEAIPREDARLMSEARPLTYSVDFTERSETKSDKQEPLKEVPTEEPQQLGSETAVSEMSKAAANRSGEVKPAIGTMDPPGTSTPPQRTISISLEVVDFPLTPAKYKGGQAALIEDVIERIEYPKEALKQSFYGKVYVEFIIEKDGTVSDVKIKRGVSPELDREAKRVVRTLNNWKPAEDAYGPVRSRAVIPIDFRVE